MNLKSHSSDDIDEAFQKVNLQYFAAENPVVKQLLYNNMTAISEEIINRNKSLKSEIKQYLKQLKGV